MPLELLECRTNRLYEKLRHKKAVRELCEVIQPEDSSFCMGQDKACRWAEFYARQTFTGSCSLVSVVRGDLGNEGFTIIEYLHGRAITPDEVTLKIPDSVDEKRRHSDRSVTSQLLHDDGLLPCLHYPFTCLG